MTCNCPSDDELLATVSQAADLRPVPSLNTAKLQSQLLHANSDPIYIEIMRCIYNVTLPQTATKPIAPKTSEEQFNWWCNLDHNKVRVHIYREVERPWNIVAWSMVTDRGNYCTPMFAIHPQFWGLGYGEEIIYHYLQVAGKCLQGSQLKSNGAICHLNARNGWRVVGEDGDVQLLLHDGPDNYPQRAYDEILRYHET